MKKEDIITLPHASLRQRSKKIGLITKETLVLIDDMKTAMLDWENSRDHEITVGLAASQVNHLLRLFIVRDQKDPEKFIVFINPEITKYEGEQKTDYEGCLSIKEVYGLVPRYETVRVKATDINGKLFSLKAKGDMARILQHETDHNNGVVFVDHIKESKDAFFKLEKNGKLTKLDCEKDILNNSILW